MKKYSTLFLAASITFALGGCASTANDSSTGSVAKATTQTSSQEMVVPEAAPITAQNGEITLKQIMADPQWMGALPSDMGWSVNGDKIVFEREKQDSALSDVFIADLTDPANATKAPLSELHKYRFDERVVRQDGVVAYSFEDSVYVQFTNGKTVQLTRGGNPLSTLSFMTDGRLMALSGSKFIAINLEDGSREELLSWEFADAPTANEPAKDYIAEEQQTLIEYIKLQRKNRVDSENADNALAKANNSVAPAPFYFDKAHRLAGISVSPAGNYAVVATTESKPSRDDSDIMPHYIQEDSRIAAKPVRRRVADAEPENHVLWLLDLKTGEKTELKYFSLPGYNDDVLADVKAENAKANGETYEVNRLPRPITLLQSWYWTKPSIRWHKNGNAVAVMLEAWDNKDRWIATVDLEDKALENQHRLHDDAWVNYRFNAFDWLAETEAFYFQSEHSGYSHLYLQTPGEKPVALTSGSYIVDDITLSPDDNFLYFKANMEHPGLYEVYRADLSDKSIDTMTDLNGMTDYVLSPDGKQLLLSHSKVNKPAELFVKPADETTPAQQITQSTSDTFNALPWAVPNVVAIPSSHTDAPIYARVYLPENYDSNAPNKAVVFNHGAGYLQNAHMGWSGYFREYMFHSMLVQQGYVVLDMDYRASAGYGRDWRTAIYRQMGTPEVQDLRDGVNWLVENANVDRARIGTYGGSYGGFLTFMSMFTAPDLFAAGAALRPVTDWAHYNTPYTANILNTPNIDPIAYERSSPIYFAEGLEKPLLINAPMVDDNVFFHDTVRLVQRLIELEKQDFETAIYPVEPHGFVQPSSWLDEYRRIYKLFEENL
ncbi:peptidase S9 [Alteromonas sp. KUL42]|uniref:S9 family peptidase n=1 Tax=Alteromonas sp. KUL42 TaxID=2480797 RepID=UPI00079C8637|nr:prolyl oligopeptidase family serine peptidase [Alteromonas sp. KUL42]KXJ60312.1 MAG: peptidase S9 [Alteromonas sp. Nap_26]TAP36708.1 S9 family peptidase [Alteromonas sp. KUL42]GEA06927.1 peptidase S9 [Alteromonas sp. KUL42]